MGRPLQLELFKTQKFQFDRPKKDRNHVNFFAFIKTHEKAMSIIIIFFIISLVSFSIGVEKGKRLTAKALLGKPRKVPESGRILNNPVKKPIIQKHISKYTIQVATFKTKTYAQKEAERLKKKGVDALIIPRGKHVIVCVGNFSKKQEAKVILSQLRKTYHDCFVRRL